MFISLKTGRVFISYYFRKVIYIAIVKDSLRSWDRLKCLETAGQSNLFVFNVRHTNGQDFN